MGTKEIIKRLEELEQKARERRDKLDETPLNTWMNDEEKAEYKELLEEYNKR